jgi:hypothetical protein
MVLFFPELFLPLIGFLIGAACAHDFSSEFASDFVSTSRKHVVIPLFKIVVFSIIGCFAGHVFWIITK